MGDHLSVQTELLTLEKIYTDNYQFSIPSYQRPYVWSDDDVLLLFRDIKEACRLKEPNYLSAPSCRLALNKMESGSMS